MLWVRARRGITFSQRWPMYLTNSGMSVRVMKGRMSGQAFVTFPSLSVAALALKCVHAVELSPGQPVVVVWLLAGLS